MKMTLRFDFCAKAQQRSVVRKDAPDECWDGTNGKLRKQHRAIVCQGDPHAHDFFTECMSSNHIQWNFINGRLVVERDDSLEPSNLHPVADKTQLWAARAKEWRLSGYSFGDDETVDLHTMTSEDALREHVNDAARVWKVLNYQSLI